MIKPLISLIVYFFVSAPNSYADIYNPNMLPIGENSTFMGNTGVGGTDDAGAVYYNPGALADLKFNQISLTGSAYFMYELGYDGAINIDNENVPYKVSGFESIPHSLVSTFKVGERTLAFSVLVPESVHISTTKEFQTTNFSGTLMPSSRNQTIWVGLSMGHRWTKQWAWGASLWGIYHSEESVTGASFRYQDGSQIMASDLSRLSVQHYSLASTLGFMFQANEALDFGLKVQSPNLRVHSEADYLRTSTFINTSNPPGSQIVTSRTEVHARNVQYEVPFDFGLGMTYRKSSRFKILTDINYQMPTEFTLIPEIREDNHYKTRGTFRYNAGAEWKVHDKLPLYFGAFYTPSTMADITAVSDNNLRSNVWGVTGGISLNSNANSQSGIGFFYAQGRGIARNSAGVELPGRLTVGGLLLSSSYIF